MSHALFEDSESKELQGLKSKLSDTAKKSKTKTAEISLDDLKTITLFMEKALSKNVVVIDEYVSPAEAAEIASVSRPVIQEMLLTGAL